MRINLESESNFFSINLHNFASHNKAKKFKKLKIVKLKVKTERFRLFAIIIHPDDGKQPKTFGFDLLILQFLTF